MNKTFWGIDIGSTTIKVVVLDQLGQILAHHYVRSEGRAISRLFAILDDLTPKFSMIDIAAVRFTGSGGNKVGKMIGCQHVNELIAQTRAVGEYYPLVRSIIEIGGQDSKFMSVSWNEEAHQMELVDFSLNTLCAAGTGSFLDQQAERLNISITKEFAVLAMKSNNPARIAGRCTVFAKSDMIHLQQIGTPLPDILAGLCLALARNFRCVIGKGKHFVPPILFQGGVAFNRAVVRAFETVLKLEQGTLIIPKYHWCMPAIGAALIAIDEAKGGELPPFEGFEPLKSATLVEGAKGKYHPKLRRSSHRKNNMNVLPSKKDNGRLPSKHPDTVYVGIDIGSISTNVVLIDENGRLVSRRYLYTKGRPLDSVCHALRGVEIEVGNQVIVKRVGVTGSGRHLVAHLVGADLVCNEISAQARAAVQIDPKVDTVFEIGGQDSKFISLKDGVVVDFAMNKACAAGTGSFLQEQAERLNIRLQEDFSRLAFNAKNPVCLGERCTVFMDADLVHHQQQGSHVNQLAAGLAYAIAQNYLNRVVNRRVIGRNIFFQGGVAGNDSVVSAFRYLTRRDITVPPHHDVTGAIGAALLALEEDVRYCQQDAKRPTKFKGFNLTTKHVETTRFECRACPNVCTVNKMNTLGDQAIYFGARCDRFDDHMFSNNHTSQIPDLFSERTDLLLSGYSQPDERRPGRPRVGFPRALMFHDMFPYWQAFFAALEFDLVLSAPTNPRILNDTARHASAEMCLPAKLIFGHVYDLIKRDIDYIFLPSVRNRENIAPGQTQNFYCPYIQTAPCLVKAHLEIEQIDKQIVTFPYYLLWPQVRKKMLKNVALELNVSFRSVHEAVLAAADAQRKYYEQLKIKGQEILGNLPPNELATVIVGHPYSTGDPAICQDLSHKLRMLGHLPIPMEYLPLNTVNISDKYDNIYWRAGQDILAAAKVIRSSNRMYAIYLTNFACGPDSYLVSYFRHIMNPKPFLLLEIDDHNADAGIITRCEAFLESIRMRPSLTNGEPIRSERNDIHSVYV